MDKTAEMHAVWNAIYENRISQPVLPMIGRNKVVPTPRQITDALHILVQACHGVSYNCGWHHDPKTGQPVRHDVGRRLMLAVSELSEAMEGHRKDLQDDKLPHRKMFDVELADASIRIFDMAGSFIADDQTLVASKPLIIGGPWEAEEGRAIQFVEAFLEKLIFNTVRQDHKPEHRAAEGGKAY